MRHSVSYCHAVITRHILQSMLLCPSQMSARRGHLMCRDPAVSRSGREGVSRPPGRKTITRNRAPHWSPCSDVAPIRGTYPDSPACRLLTEVALSTSDFVHHCCTDQFCTVGSSHHCPGCPSCYRQLSRLPPSPPWLCKPVLPLEGQVGRLPARAICTVPSHHHLAHPPMCWAHASLPASARLLLQGEHIRRLQQLQMLWPPWSDWIPSSTGSTRPGSFLSADVLQSVL